MRNYLNELNSRMEMQKKQSVSLKAGEQKLSNPKNRNKTKEK